MLLLPHFKGRSLISPDITLPLMKLARPAFMISMAAVVLSLALFAIRGLNYGVDFKGGTMLEVQSKGENSKADITFIRNKVSSLGLGDVQIQSFGSERDVLIRIEQQRGGEEAQQQALGKVLAALGDAYERRRVEVVGPAVSSELRTTGLIAVLCSIVAIILYVWFRFEWQFAVGAVVALAHDVLVTVGVFSLLQLEFDLSTVAALLTILGYSVNDTVVISDRIRENLRRYKRMPLTELLDRSLNETLTRTVMTSLTTIVVLIALLVLGGAVIRNFAFAMTFGVIIGTYSSVFVVAPLLLFLGVKRDWSGLNQGAAGTPENA
ncbi:MAG: protein translocase subunit SecF [Hyphomicrobiaceae bacterium]|nr:protein translocase subunit SecF [Hyphomicrobiaceae bacterium]